MLKTLLLKLAQRKLENAVKHEELLRTSAKWMREVEIPRLEEVLQQREVDCAVAQHLKGSK